MREKTATTTTEKKTKKETKCAWTLEICLNYLEEFLRISLTSARKCLDVPNLPELFGSFRGFLVWHVRGSVWTLEISLDYVEVSAAGFLACARRDLFHLRTVQVGNQCCMLGIHPRD